jgi:hypothetical protein
MPRVIVKCRYYQNNASLRDIGGMLRYIATRKGVEKYEGGWKTEPVSKSQEDLIQQLTKERQGSRQLDEYRDYIKARTKGAASEFISAVFENYPELLSGKTYLDYIATRPRVERIAKTHGLFSEEGVAIDLAQEAERMRNHNGYVFTVIVSLKREDAEQFGYNNAEHWMDLVRGKIDLIAKAHNIPDKALKWYGAFHNESHHPHIHLMLYSTDPCFKGRISNTGIDQMRHMFGTEIFRDALKQIYDDQTKYRNQINADALDEIESLSEKIRTGLGKNDEFVSRFVALAKHLQSVGGKKVYGYLPKSLNQQVCDLVDLLKRDEDIARIYELWYQAKCDVYHTYTDTDPVRKPLSQEEAFKPIRNAMIKEANELGMLLNAADESAEESATPPSGSGSTGTPQPAPAPPPSPGATATPTVASPCIGTIRNGKIVTSVARLGKNISQTFRNNFYAQTDKLPALVDSKLQREIEAKKKGQNLSM